jgi:hypothetical protein
MKSISHHIKSLCFIFLFWLLAGCAPSESAIATAIAQTQAANPTMTPTSTYTPTATITSTPSPTPDVRVIASLTS